ncbi:BRCA1-A complex subunit BRE [Liparis tanakae]|uniref:BRISC and BRCA1-A complex member 2 n=1 Tax=Liparis tanakae TaxID=230148 RepID=A0A4Z2G3P6_9TELE|nr:BRCA1-A complex subunit BRE [Liparis tanakae]
MGEIRRFYFMMGKRPSTETGITERTQSPQRTAAVSDPPALCLAFDGVFLNALGGSSALHIPAFPSGGCLIDYVPQVCQLLNNKTQTTIRTEQEAEVSQAGLNTCGARSPASHRSSPQAANGERAGGDGGGGGWESFLSMDPTALNPVQYVIQGYHKRREYIAAFLSHFGMGVVEYDAEGFTKLTLLLMWKDFCFLVHVDLPLYFPRDQPTLTFQSVYHFTSSGQLYSQVQKSYPYSPRWDGNEMAKRAK